MKFLFSLFLLPKLRFFSSNFVKQLFFSPNDKIDLTKNSTKIESYWEDMAYFEELMNNITKTDSESSESWEDTEYFAELVNLFDKKP